MTEPAGTARTARLTIGLPTYNGEAYLAESLDALLAQTFEDFVLIISDNASTDSTPEIARRYAEKDDRIRYVRHPRNVGSAENHNFVIREARTEYFKWASDDDLYAPTLLERCIEALDRRPEIVLAHSGTAFIDADGRIIDAQPYPLTTDVASPRVRLRSLLRTFGGDDIYGVIRTSVLRSMPPHDSYHNADRVFVSELALHGRFHVVPEALYFRRDHPGRTERVSSIRERCARLDQRRADALRHPVPRLLAEYILGYVRAIAQAPLTVREKAGCLAELGLWLASRANPLQGSRLEQSPDPAIRAHAGKENS